MEYDFKDSNEMELKLNLPLVRTEQLLCHVLFIRMKSLKVAACPFTSHNRKSKARQDDRKEKERERRRTEREGKQAVL